MISAHMPAEGALQVLAWRGWAAVTVRQCNSSKCQADAGAAAGQRGCRVLPPRCSLQNLVTHRTGQQSYSFFLPLSRWRVYSGRLWGGFQLRGRCPPSGISSGGLRADFGRPWITL